MISGTVSAMGADMWTVGSTTVYMSPKTSITGKVSVGDTAEVTGIKTTEGAVIASAITKP